MYVYLRVGCVWYVALVQRVSWYENETVNQWQRSNRHSIIACSTTYTAVTSSVGGRPAGQEAALRRSQELYRYRSRARGHFLIDPVHLLYNYIMYSVINFEL